MAYAFDTLGYANHLKKAGVDAIAAEAHAEAAREFIMSELTTKGDLVMLRSDLDSRFALFDAKLNAAVQSMTIRLGGIMVAGVGIIILAMRFLGIGA